MFRKFLLIITVTSVISLYSVNNRSMVTFCPVYDKDGDVIMALEDDKIVSTVEVFSAMNGQLRRRVTTYESGRQKIEKFDPQG